MKRKQLLWWEDGGNTNKIRPYKMLVQTQSAVTGSDCPRFTWTPPPDLSSHWITGSNGERAVRTQTCFHIYLTVQEEHFTCGIFSANLFHVDMQNRMIMESKRCLLGKKGPWAMYAVQCCRLCQILLQPSRLGLKSLFSILKKMERCLFQMTGWSL